MNASQAPSESALRQAPSSGQMALQELPRGVVPHPAERLRYQLLFVLVFALLIPAGLAQLIFNEEPLKTVPSQISLGASFMAALCALIARRQMSVVPGVMRAGADLPSLIFFYAVAFIIVLSLRLEYSRVILISGFVSCALGQFLLLIKGRSVARGHFWLVPLGNIDRVRNIPDMAWEELKTPTLPPTSQRGIVADLRHDLPPEWERMLAAAVLAGAPVYHFKQLEESLTGRVDIEHLSENTLGSLSPDGSYLALKRGVDFLVSLALLPVLLPFFGLVALLIKLDSPGPVFFRQERVGQRGQSFRVIKFRTMRTQAEPSQDAVSQAITRDGDDRITAVGKYLRRLRIDELPQVFNVLMGQMSWIGPRPEAKSLSAWYDESLPFYSYRHIVKPGITGWAQVNQGHVADLNEVHEKLRYDFYYIKHFSIWLDLSILARTIRVIFDGFGSK